MKDLPTVVAGRDGRLAIQILEFQRAAAAEMRDAVSYYFRAKLEPDGQVSRLQVLFSGTVYSVRPDAFGLISSGDREADFVQFALAAVGDYLDTVGTPGFTPSGVSAHSIECMSPQFQSWADRDRASDDVIEKYIRAHLFWTWKYGLTDWQIGTPDALRLNRGIDSINRIVTLGLPTEWTVRAKTDSAIRLTPGSELIRAERSRRQTPVDTQTAVPPPLTGDSAAAEAPSFVYVDESRIAELRALTSANYDFRKLIAICEELNQCYRSQCYHAVAALTRALVDHVPPVFGYTTFAELANNYSGGKSFKACMGRLDQAARKIADQHLHQQIRRTESLPNRTQVTFSNEIDVLLAELIRVTRDRGDSATSE